MNRIGSGIDFQIVGFASDGKMTSSYAIGITPRRFAHAGIICIVIDGIGITKSHVPYFSVPVRNINR